MPLTHEYSQVDLTRYQIGRTFERSNKKHGLTPAFQTTNFGYEIEIILRTFHRLQTVYTTLHKKSIETERSGEVEKPGSFNLNDDTLQSFPFQSLIKAVFKLQIFTLTQLNLPYSVYRDSRNYKVGCSLFTTYTDVELKHICY